MALHFPDHLGYAAVPYLIRSSLPNVGMWILIVVQDCSVSVLIISLVENIKVLLNDILRLETLGGFSYSHVLFWYLTWEVLKK